MYFERKWSRERARNPIFVNGIWKSGNHLLYSALNMLGIQGPFNGIAAHLLFGRHMAVKRLIRGTAKGIDIGLETEALIKPGYIRRTLRRLPGKILGGHAAFSSDLLNLLHEERANVIVIRRDPRDVLVSFADWIEDRPDYFMHTAFADLSREQRVERLLRGGKNGDYRLRPFTEVLSRAEGWLTAGDAVLTVAFEDLIGPRGGGSLSSQMRALTSICHHLGRAPPDTPEVMQGFYGGSLTFNKGRTERWRELSSSDLQSEVAERLAPHLARWGYGPAIEKSSEHDTA